MKENTWTCSKKEVTKEDVDQFILEAYSMLEKMFVDKFGTDADGDIPVDFHFVNRVVFEPLHFFCISYSHLLETPKEKLERLYDMFTNLSILQGRLDVDLRVLRTDREFDKVICGETEDD